VPRAAAPPADPPLLAAVREALAGVMDVRAYMHPSRPGKVAVRGAFWQACAVVLERAGFPVERGAGWLTVGSR
jgi:hypothetical protein